MLRATNPEAQTCKRSAYCHNQAQYILGWFKTYCLWNIKNNCWYTLYVCKIKEVCGHLVVDYIKKNGGEAEVFLFAAAVKNLAKRYGDLRETDPFYVGINVSF